MRRKSFAFALIEGLPLPHVGEFHPLQRNARKTLYNATLAAGSIHMMLTLIWMLYLDSRSSEISSPRIVITRLIDMGVPPSIQQALPPQVSVALQTAVPAIGIPEPVPDFQAVETTIATLDQMSEVLVPTDISMIGGRDLLVVDLGTQNSPGPTDFVAVEALPVLISMPAPVYPELARMAGLEGSVIVRILVGKDGNAADAIIVQGSEMFNESALASARQAKFRPALQQHHPVATWVNQVINFVLH